MQTRHMAAILSILFVALAVAGGTRLRGQTSLCGNGIVNEGEECDEGGRNGIGPNCTSECTDVRCGDGIVSQSAGEECDTGTASSAPSCGQVCTVPECDDDGKNCTGGCEWQIVACTSSSSSATSSGSAASVSSASSASIESPQSSAVVASSISSAVSNAASSVVLLPSLSSSGSVSSETSTGSSLSRTSTGSARSSVVSVAPPKPFVPVCGDRWIQGEEQCDDGNLVGGDGCSAVCKTAPVVLARCGNGVLEPPEQCDNGGANSNTASNACRTDCKNPRCGDGVVDEGEPCDDGNANPYDGCTWNCVVTVCGNNIVEVQEECDSGEANSNTTPNACRTVCRKPWCGDAVVDAGEECDDGNADDEDGCTSTCQLVCPEGAQKIGGKCAIVDSCGFACQITAYWDQFVTWLFSFFPESSQ